jgi:hypothetical protein
VLTPLQHCVTAKERCNEAQNKMMAAVPEDQSVDLCNTVHRKGRCKKRSKHGQLCQRIRVLTPLQHSAPQRTLQEAQKQTWAAARGSEC